MDLTNILSLIAAFISAMAAIYMGKLTKILATETQKMADAVSQPHVTVTFIPNQWNMDYFDIHIDNTGNATAYDIEITYPDELKRDISDDFPNLIPFKTISILKPNQNLNSSFASAKHLHEISQIEISISWKRKSIDNVREYNQYIINMKDYEIFGRLGELNPNIAIANHTKKIADSLKHIERNFK